MALMNDVLRPFLRKCIIVFLDDISLRSFAVSEEKRLETRRRIALPRGKRLNASVHVVLCHTVVSYCNWRRQQMTSRVCPGVDVSSFKVETGISKVIATMKVDIECPCTGKPTSTLLSVTVLRRCVYAWYSAADLAAVTAFRHTRSLSSKSQGPIVPLRLWHLLSVCLAVSLSVCIETSNLKQHC